MRNFQEHHFYQTPPATASVSNKSMSSLEYVKEYVLQLACYFFTLQKTEVAELVVHMLDSCTK